MKDKNIKLCVGREGVRCAKRNALLWQDVSEGSAQPLFVIRLSDASCCQ